MNHHEPLDVAIMGIQPRHKFPLSPGFRDNAKIREGLLKDQDRADELWRGFLCGLAQFRLGVATEVRGWCHGLVKWIYHDLFFFGHRPSHGNAKHFGLKILLFRCRKQRSCDFQQAMTCLLEEMLCPTRMSFTGASDEKKVRKRDNMEKLSVIGSVQR